MYSIVLMAAMTTTPDAPQFNGYFRDLFHGSCNGCNGCSGCSGAARYSCSGCCGSSAYTASCSGCNGCCGGCCGGTVFGWGLGDRVRSWFEPSGCCGSRNYGCCGGTSFAAGCCGGMSYASGCCGASAYSCFGGPAYSYTPVFNGGLACQGGLPYSAPPPTFDATPDVPFAVPAPAPGQVGVRPAAHTGTALVSSGPAGRATVLVRLPADARLFADGKALTLTGPERKFVSPELPADQEFVYRFTAEYERNGETVAVTRKVAVRAGATAAVEFADLTAAARPSNEPTGLTSGLHKGAVPAAKPAAREPVQAEPAKSEPAPARPAPAGGDRATITVKLPPGAALFVDDRRSPSLDPVRSFSTPPLPAGREYAYLLKAEVIRDGRPESLTQKVPFRAGERVIVDFTSLGR